MPTPTPDPFSARRRLAVGALALAFALAGCKGGGGGHGGPGGHRGAPPVPVRTAKALVKTTPVEISAIGNVEAANTVEVRPQVGGILEKVAFSEGDAVKKGQVLFTIDPAPYRATLDQAEAKLAKDRVIAANDQVTFKRMQALRGKGYIDKGTFDTAKANADSSAATVKVDQAALESARLNLSWTTLRSPIAGRTGRLLVQAGNLVSPQSAQSLVTIRTLRPIYVTFSIPEDRLAEVRREAAAGDALAVTATPAGGKAHTGKLSFVDNAVEAATGTVVLKATFPNDDDGLWPGQFVNVVLVVRRQQNSVVVPDQAVQTSQKGNFVFVVEKGDTVKMQPVKVGAHLQGEVVIDTGLKGGETVVTDGQLKLTPGSKIEPVTGAAAAGGEAS